MVVEEDEIHLMHQLVEEYGTFSSTETPGVIKASEGNVSSKGEVVVRGSILSITIGLVIAKILRFLPVPPAP